MLCYKCKLFDSKSGNWHCNVSRGCKSSMRQEFYYHHENNRTEWFILLIESSNCVGKREFQFAWNIERTERGLGREVRDDMSRNLSMGAK